MLAGIARSARVFLSPALRLREFDVLFELQACAGIADMAIVHFDEREADARERSGFQPIDDLSAVRVLLQLRDGPRTVAELAATLAMSPGHLRGSVLRGLADRGFVSRRDDGTWKAARAFRPLARDIVSVEVKRRDWRGGLAQARRYVPFSNWTWLVTDACVAHLLRRNRAVFVGSSIGTATIDSVSNQLRVVQPPVYQRTPVSQAAFMLAAERAWSLRLRGLSSGPVLPVFGQMLTTTSGADPRLPGGASDPSRG